MHILLAVVPSALLLLVAVAAVALARNQPQDEAAALHGLFDQEWLYDLEQDPVRASILGDRRWNDRWPDVTLAAIDQRARHYREVLARVGAIEHARLSVVDQLNVDLFKREYDERLAELSLGWHVVSLDQRGGIQTTSELAEILPFESSSDYENWLARLVRFPAYMDATTDLLREGITRRLVQPKHIVERIQGQVARQIVADPQSSPYFEPFTRFPESVPPDDQARLTGVANDAIRTSVVPAFENLQRFLANEYHPAAYDRSGIWQAPNGEALYGFFARRFTSTALTPQQIHEMGQQEVTRIRGEMQAIMDTEGFQGTLQEFFAWLRTDPRFYYGTPDALLQAYRALSKRLDPLLVRLFTRLPRTPYGVEPIPDLTAPDTTTAYYQPAAADGSRAGIYYVNLYRPDTRPIYEMMALSLHEAVPGHHLQIALAMEQESLPQFRRHAEYTAFVEGWALYAESLGDEVGLYDDPYSKFGQLTYEMWRAVRLVVDTGIHTMRWSRGQAIDFFMANAAKTEADIVNEIDRYIAWPGQALAYKIGELRIKELRRETEEALGARFDLREFHDALLEHGALPLDVVERRMTNWIDQRRAQ